MKEHGSEKQIARRGRGPDESKGTGSLILQRPETQHTRRKTLISSDKKELMIG
jgi:hypothetical protein